MITLFFILKWAVIIALVVALTQILIPLLWIVFILGCTTLIAMCVAVFYSFVISLNYIEKMWRRWHR
jgi:hypothetical protein